MHAIYAYVIAVFVGLNLLYVVLVHSLLARRRPYPRALGWGVAIWGGLMVALLLLQFLAPHSWVPFVRRWLYLPIAVDMVWNLLLLQVLVLGAIVVALGLRWFRPVPPKSAAVPDELPGFSRRRFVYLLACGAAPTVALGMGVHGSVTRYDLRVRHFDIPIAGLPPELRNFTIAHVSDLHSGIFCGPRRLEMIRSATNDLRADLIAVTGDLINHAMDEFPDALVALQGMEARHGLFICEGNHDVIPGPGLVAQACRKNGLPFLLNETATLAIGDSRLIIAGLPWFSNSGAGHPEIVDRLYPQRKPGDVRILLAHHPDLFDIATSSDLVLSGHTHGGQIMAGDIGFGPLFFKYWSGAYRHGASLMIVSNGCGDWFPCRVGAPAEIGLLRLVAA